MKSLLFPQNIPSELKAIPQWVCWRYQRVGGRITKVPKCPHNPTQNANVRSPQTWGTFDAARDAVRRKLAHGVGLVLTRQLCLVAWDFDLCIDQSINQSIDPRILHVVQLLNSYTEITPSKRGLRVLCYGVLPNGKRRRGHVEVYSDGRYVTITGCRLDGSPPTIEKRSKEIYAIYKTLFSENQRFSEDFSLSSLNDKTPLKDKRDPSAELPAWAQKILECTNRPGTKFHRLWNSSDSAGYPSPSEADLALANILVRLVDGDLRRAEFLFSISPRGQREKWRTRPDYRHRTLNAACNPPHT